MARERSDRFTGLEVEPHSVLPGQQVCVAYRNGKRVGVLYFNEARLRLVFESDEQLWVEKRLGLSDFERVYENGGV